MKFFAKKNLLSLLVLLMVVVSGCRSIKAPPSPQAQWQPSAALHRAQTNDLTWKTIRENKPDLSKPLALSELLDLSLKNNPTTRQAWYNARSQVNLLKKAQGAYYPQVNVAGQSLFEKDFGTSGEFNSFNYGPQLQLTWLILDCGGRAGSIEQALQNAIAANYSFNQTFQGLLLNILSAYYGLNSAQEGVVAAEASVKDAQTSLEIARQKLDAGLATMLDVLQTEAVYNKSLFSLESAKGQVKTAQAGLAQVLGYPGDAVFQIIAPTNVPNVMPVEDMKKLIDDALGCRPDIGAARAALKSQAAAVRVARSAMLPSLNAVSSAYNTWYNYHNPPSNANDEMYQYKAGLAIQWNVFDGFSNYNNWKAAKEQYEASKEQLINAELSASANVWTNYYSVQTAVKQLEFSQAYLGSSTEAYKLAYEGYNAGIKNILDLINAQTDLADARSKYVSSAQSVYVSMANLAYATGTIDAGGEYFTLAPERKKNEGSSAEQTTPL